MRKIILAFIFMLVSAIGAFAQSTTVSGTVTDAGSQAWANGTYQFIFQPNPQFPTGPYTWTGGALNNVISGSLDGSGNYSVSIPSNSAITPAGSTWILKATPNATSQGFSTPRTTITGGTQTLNVTPPVILISWAIPPGPAISAYTDAEIGGPLPKGAEYFNVTSSLTRVWDGSAWKNQGSGSGGGACPSGAAGNLQYTDGTNCASTANLNYNAATGALILQGNVIVGIAAGGSAGFTAGATGNNSILVNSSAGGGAFVEANETGGIVTLQAVTGTISLISQNLNTTGAEFDVGGSSSGSGVFGLLGGTSGTCTLTVNATGTSVASSCPITGTGISPGGSAGDIQINNGGGSFVNLASRGGGGVFNATNTSALTIEPLQALSLISANNFVTAQSGDAAAVTIGSVTQRAVTGTTDTILSTDRQNRVAYNSASAVAVTLPQAGVASGFISGFNARLSNQNTGVVTVTPTSTTINGNATLVISEGQDCFLTPSSTGTTWAADCNEPQMTAGTGISLTRGVHSLSIASSPVGCQSGCSYALGLGGGTLGVGATGSPLAVANQPLAFRINNETTRSISTGCFLITTAAAAGNADVAVYSVSGTALTRIWHTGAKSTTGTGQQCATPATATVTAGQPYYVFYCADNTTSTVSQLTGGSGNVETMMAGAGAPANTYGIDATDVSTGGVCPATATTTNIVNSTTKFAATWLQVFN